MKSSLIVAVVVALLLALMGSVFIVRDIGSSAPAEWATLPSNLRFGNSRMTTDAG